MDDNRTLVLAVLVVLVLGGVAFLFGGFTGAVARESEKRISRVCVSSDPDVACEEGPRLSAGDLLYITVQTGSEGTSNVLGFYDKNAPTYKRRATTTLDEGCGGTSCRPNRVTTKKYKVDNDWSGKFCARVFDRAVGKHVEACFFVG